MVWSSTSYSIKRVVLTHIIEKVVSSAMGGHFQLNFFGYHNLAKLSNYSIIGTSSLGKSIHEYIPNKKLGSSDG